ncbi:MAG: methylenetetrahydrofolate reductase [Candidatus Omnitrophica bacterium]|nr:methylenetetrahydrofolate reductase [Candidatus Omnitrophota bacterium]
MQNKSFREKIMTGEFVVSSEIGPPKGIGRERILEEAEIIRPWVDAVNITDLQSSVMRLGSLAVSVLLKQKGFDPIYQVTCRDRNRLALQSDLLSAAMFGIENVLALTGDYTTAGDHPEAKPVFDLDSVQLLQVMHLLNDGFDLNENKLEGDTFPRFFPGAAVNPGADPVEPEIMKMEKKVVAGARFFQTQAIFDVKTFEAFIKKTEHIKVPVIAGIVFLKSAAMAHYMNKNVAGISVPEYLIKEMEAAPDKAAASVEIAARLIRELQPMCKGIHLMPIGWNKMVPIVLELSGFERRTV